MHQRARAGTGLLAAVGVAFVAGLGRLTVALAAAVQEPGTATLGDVLGLAAAGAAWAVLGWLVLGLGLCLAAGRASPGSRPALARLAARITPGSVRRLAAALLGAGLLAAPALPAAATAAATGTPSPAATAPAAAGAAEAPTAGPLPGWTPDRPAPHTTPRTELPPPSRRSPALLVPPPRPRLAVADEVVVRRGDTLWDIAARALGARASTTDVAASWPRWYAANRAVVGPDPDLIRPGQRLRPPAPH